MTIARAIIAYGNGEITREALDALLAQDVGPGAPKTDPPPRGAPGHELDS